MLYIMRHGKTDWNELHKLQGRTDIPLNEKGREMAEQVREECAEIGFDVCYTSPLIRARETAQIALDGLGVPIITDDRLVEMCFGKYEGSENAADIPGSPIKTFFEEPEKYKGAEGAETFDELFARTGEFIEEVIKPELSQNKNVLIVGHGAMNSSIICQIKQKKLDKFWEAGIPNCKLIRLI